MTYGPGWEAGQAGRVERLRGEGILWALSPPQSSGCVLRVTRPWGLPSNLRISTESHNTELHLQHMVPGCELLVEAIRGEGLGPETFLLRPGQPDPTPTWVSS